MVRENKNEPAAKLINLAVFNQQGRDFCDHTNTFASSYVDYPPPPIGDGGYIRPGGFCIYEVNIALMYVQKYRNAGAPFIKWCELHQPDELMVSCQGFLRCLSPADVKKYELSYRVLDLAIDNDLGGGAGNLLKYFQNHPYTAVIPYSVLKLHRDPNRNNQAIKSIGIDAQAQDWPLGSRFNLWWDVERVSFIEVLVGSSAVNSMAEEYAQKAAHTLEKSNDRHQGWDDIEVIGSVTNELESPDVSFWEWLFAAMYDAPEAEVDENGHSLVKVICDDGATSYFRLQLQHVDASDYTVEGWVVTNLRPLAAFGSDEEDEAAEYEQELLEDYQEA